MATRKPTTSNKEKDEIRGAAPDPTSALSAAIAMFDEEFAELNLWGKLATISGFLGRIPKNGHNKFHDYWYVLESDLVEHIRYYLAAARILIYPHEIREHHVHTFEPINGKQRDILTDSIYVWRAVDGRTGDSFTFESIGQGSDPRDKGANKASTSAMKFAYLRLFNIASGEDAEGDEQGDARAAQSGPVAVTVTAGRVAEEEVQRGGRQATASGAQIRSISNLSNELSLGAVGLAGVIKRVLGDEIDLGEDETKHSAVLAKYLKDKDGESVGKVIFALQEMAKAVEGGGGYE